MKVIDFIKNLGRYKEYQKIEQLPPQRPIIEEPTNVQSVVNTIEKDFIYRTKRTIRDWRQALELAEDPRCPNRYELLQIYEDIILDLTVEGAMNQRRERILSTDWEVINKKDKSVNVDLTKKLHSKWFYDTLGMCVDSIFYGHSLIQINGITIDDNISNVELVERMNVIPEFGEIKKKTNSTDVYSYMNKLQYQWLFEYMKDPEDLGLLMKLTPLVLYKKEAVKAWNRFSEAFGMPIRVVKTGKKNPKDRARLENMLKNIASNAYMVLGLEDELELTSTQGDANKVFEQLIKMINNEIYKAILGQSMSSEDSASYSQAYLHNKMFNYKVQMDLRNLIFWVNDYMIPKLKQLGVFDKSDEVEFRFIDEEKLVMTERINIDTALLQYYELGEEYIEERYKVPVKGTRDKNTGSSMKVEDKTEQKPDVQKRNK